MRVFVSFSSGDREIKNTLVQALRDGLPQDVEIWDSDEKCNSDFSRECIEAIDESQVFIVLLSESSMAPTSYVKDEVVEAKKCEGNGLLNIVIFGVDNTPMIPDFRFNLNHISDANRLARVHGNDSGYADTVRRVKNLLMLRAEGRPEKPNDVNLPVLDAIIPGPTGYFVPDSRNEVFRQIDDAFTRSNIVFLSQIGGYGRSTAARKYAETHSENYKTIYLFPFFSGSLRRFLLDGVQIMNLNEQAFSGMSETDILKKKVKILKKLDRDTLLIVPGVTPDEQDDRFLFDLLGSIGCRVLFITQSNTKALMQTFPVIPVGRMEERCLKELFFNYYECSEAEQTHLAEPLTRFFDSVDGHTKTVELTASAISDEWGVSADETEEILKRITKHESQGVAANILSAISDLFDFREFDETEQQILLIAAIIGLTPVNESDFVEVLKNAGCFDRKKLSRLAEQRWLSADRTAKLISVDKFFADVCLEKTTPADGTIMACFNYLYICFFCSSLQFSESKLSCILKMLARLCRVIKLPLTENILDAYADAIGDPEKIRGIQILLSDAEREFGQYRQHPDITEFLSAVAKSVKLVTQIANEQQNRNKTKDPTEILLLLNHYTDQISADEQTDAETNALVSALKTMTQRMSDTPERIIDPFISFVQTILLQESDTEFSAITEYVLTLLCCFFLANINDSYICYQICDLRYKIADRFGGFNSEKDLFNTKIYEFESLVGMNDAGEQTQECFILLTELIPTAAQDTLNKEKFYHFFASECEDYIDMLLRGGHTETALTAANSLIDVFRNAEAPDLKLFGMIKDVAFALIGDGRKPEAISLVRAMLDLAVKDPQNTQNSETARKEVLSLKDMLAALLAPPETLFGNKEGYKNYYTTYADRGDRKKLARYEAIAEMAEQIDFSGCSEDELKAIKRKLTRRATAGEPMEKLEPEGFALVSEAGFRTLGYRHHRVQYMGAAAMLDGCIAEIANGEGKTYTIPLVAFIHTLYGKQVHIADQSIYLSRRNYGWMRGIFELLDCPVGYMKNFYSKIEDRSVIYTPLEKLAFRMLHEEYGKMPFAEHPLRYDVMLLDEADDAIERGTHIFILSTNQSPTEEKIPMYLLADRVLSGITDTHGNMFTVENRTVTLGNGIFERISAVAGRDYTSFSDIERATLREALNCGITARFVLKPEKDYFIKETENGISFFAENTKTGMFDRIAPEFEFFILRQNGASTEKAKTVLKEKKRLNQISLYSLIHTYDVFCGTTATASSVKAEFEEYYNKSVVRIPTDRPVIRKENTPMMYMDSESRDRALVSLIREEAVHGRPVLVVCETVTHSRRIHRLLSENGTKAALLNAENSEDRPEMLADAGRLGQITITTALANRGVNICLGGNPAELAKKEMIQNGVDPSQLEQAIYTVNSFDQQAAALRNQHRFLTSLWTVKLADERQQVIELGGLCVIGTVCFKDLRMEQQLIGRCGRQGYPGESFILFSAEDDSLQKLFGNNRIRAIKNMMGSEAIPADEGNILGKSLKKARLRIQENDYSDIDSTMDAICLAPVRRRFLAPVRIAHAPETPLRDAIYEIFSADRRFTDSMLMYLHGKELKITSAFVRTLTGFPQARSVSKTDLLKDMAAAAESIIKENYRTWSPYEPAFILASAFADAWTEFINRMRQEYKIVPDDRNFRKVLHKSVETTSREFYFTCADQVLNELISLSGHDDTKEICFLDDSK